MAGDNEVRISFSASVDDALGGIEQIRASLGHLTEQIGSISADANRLRDTLGNMPAFDLKVPQSGSIGALTKEFLGLQKDVQGAINSYTKAAMEQYNVTIKIADENFNMTREHLGAELKMHELTADQETAALLAALDQRHAEQERAVDGELQLLARGTAAYDKAFDQRKMQEIRYLAERQKIVDQAAEEEAKRWKDAADQISGAINSQLRDILSGHESLRQALVKISGDIVLKFLQDQIKLTIEWLANQARIVAGHIAGETAMTGATTAGAALRTAANVATGQTSILETLANALKSIFASAGQTAAGVSANVAPEAGPAAPAIGAAAGAAVVATATGMLYEKGTDYIVSGGLALLHPGEMVVPAGMNTAKGTGPYTGGGMGGVKMGDVHIHTQPGQTVDHAQLAREILKQTRQRGVFAPNKLRMA